MVYSAYKENKTLSKDIVDNLLREIDVDVTQSETNKSNEMDITLPESLTTILDQLLTDVLQLKDRCLKTI